MTCAEVEPLLGASLDGELEPQTALGIESHLAGCDACSGRYRRLEMLREEIAAAEPDWSASADLAGLRARILRQNAPAPPWWKMPWFNRSLMAATATVAIVLVAIFLPWQGGGIDRQVVDNHVRSLMAEHLIDVPSSDRHTVKPWFQGKLNFSPSVPDLTTEGFVLVGGRLDVIGARPAAAIVYKRQAHVINLWMAPAGAGGPETRQADLDGYHLFRWQQNGMTYWAVSDLNAVELRQFVDLIRSR